jgi:hypothetical protein
LCGRQGRGGRSERFFSSDKDNLCAAVNELKALQNQIEAQKGKKISAEAADLLIAYVNNLISQLISRLPAGGSC